MATEKRLIDANRLKKVFNVSLEGTYTIEDSKTASIMAGTIIACGILIDEQPTVDAVPVVHGRWIADLRKRGIPIKSELTFYIGKNGYKGRYATYSLEV